MIAVLFPAEGNPLEMEYKGTLEQLQSAVNGYVERIPFTIDDHILEAWVNEEGRLLNLPANDFVSDMIGFSYRDRNFMAFGDILITAPDEHDLSTSRGLNESEISLLRSMWNARQVAMELMSMIDRIAPQPPMHTLN